MGKSSYSDDFKRDSVHQIVVRGYPVREVSQRLGVSTHSLYKWMKVYARTASQGASVDHEAENRRLKRDLARMTEERDILKNSLCYGLAMKGSSRSLIGGLGAVGNPVKKRGPWVDANLRVVTLLLR